MTVSDPAVSDPAVSDIAVSPSGKPVGWPCTRCDEVVPLDEMHCPACGTGFLADSREEAEFVARLARGGISKKTQAFIMIGGSFAIIFVLVTLMYLASLLF
jgi:RNA polymerase subunit RPABC4/transcription elongation factor Spt4